MVTEEKKLFGLQLFFFQFFQVSSCFKKFCFASPSLVPGRQPGGVPRYGWYRFHVNTLYFVLPYVLHTKYWLELETGYSLVR